MQKKELELFMSFEMTGETVYLRGGIVDPDDDDDDMDEDDDEVISPNPTDNLKKKTNVSPLNLLSSSGSLGV